MTMTVMRDIMVVMYHDEASETTAAAPMGLHYFMSAMDTAIAELRETADKLVQRLLPISAAETPVESANLVAASSSDLSEVENRMACAIRYVDGLTEQLQDQLSRLRV